MSRVPTERPPHEHHATVSRMYRQISMDEKMAEKRKAKILEALQTVLAELQAEMRS